MHALITIFVAFVLFWSPERRTCATLQSVKVLLVSVASLPCGSIFVVSIFFCDFDFLVCRCQIMPPSSNFTLTTLAPSAKVPMPDDDYHYVENIKSYHYAALPKMQGSIGQEYHTEARCNNEESYISYEGLFANLELSY
jgi:hypothetical protein